MIFTKFIFLKRKRLPIVLFNSLYSMMNLLWTFMMSYIVIKKESVGFWGDFMTLFAIVSFGSHLIKWGNKTYLLKEYSQNPSKIKEIWQNVLYARFPIYILVSIVLAIIYFNDKSLLIVILLWISCDYVFSSMESHILYFKKFKVFFVLELIVLAISLVMIFTFNISIKLLLGIYLIRGFIKTCFAIFLFKRTIQLKPIAFDYNLLKKLFPFFLIGLIGLLNSKLDFYAIMYFLDEDAIGKYHILSNFILFGITIGSFIITPFEKNIFRLKMDKVHKLASNFFVLGIIITIFWMIFARFFIQTIYKIDFPIGYYLLSVFFMLPIYYYWPLLHKLYANEKINIAILIGVFSVVISGMASLILVPNYGIPGALICAIIGQFVNLICLKIVFKKFTF